MKKLLFITALLAMGTMAMGANLAKDNKANAEVKVRAEIVDDKFKITDIYGQPLILDFHEVPKDTAINVVTSVRYKVTANAEFDGTQSAEFKMEILGDAKEDGTHGKTVELTHVNPEITTSNKLTATLGLDADTKYLLVGEKEFQGVISGKMQADTSSNETGEYLGYATLTATVGKVDGK